MKYFVFITVRTASKRLPKKALIKIGQKPLIQILLERIKKSKNIEKIVVCTTTLRSDDKLTRLLKSKKIEVFRGNSRDILMRLYHAAMKYNTEKFVVVEGDDLFCDPLLIDETCNILSKTDDGFLFWKGVPFGSSPLGIKTQNLCELVKIKKTLDTETGWGQFIINSGLFKTKQLQPKNKKLIRPEIRLSIDYKEDLILAKKILSLLKKGFSLLDIIELFDSDKSLSEINALAKKKYEQHFTKKMIKAHVKKKDDLK